LIVLGSDGTADAMVHEVRHLCVNDEFLLREDDDDDDMGNGISRENVYNLDYR
jgi:hypothetical protein